MAASTKSIHNLIPDKDFNRSAQAKAGSLTPKQSTDRTIVKFTAHVKDELFERDVILNFNPLKRRTVGSTKDNDLYLFDRSVSHLQAFFVLSGEKLFVADCCSPAGTFINGVRLARGEKQSVSDSDTIQFGDAWVTIVRY